MKTFKSLLVLLFIANVCYLQNGNTIARIDNRMLTDPHTRIKGTVKKSTYALQHSQIAVDQLTDHLRKNTQYPTLMRQNCIEGTVIVKVRISKKGKIKHTEIVKSPNRAFDVMVLNSLKEIRAIDLQQSNYEGKPVVFVPLKFALN